MRKQPNDSGSSEPDQWQVVKDEPVLMFQKPHIWRLVRLRNQAGRLSGGLQCAECGKIEAWTKSQLSQFGTTPVQRKIQ